MRRSHTCAAASRLAASRFLEQTPGLAALRGCALLCRSSAADVAADSHQKLWHAEALLAAEHDRVRLLENQLADATTRYEGVMAELSTAQAETRSARSDGADSGRRLVHVEAHVKTLQGRVKVLEAQVEAAVLLEAELRGNVQQLESERHATAASAAKEHSSLSSALRAARARCSVPLVLSLCAVITLSVNGQVLPLHGGRACVLAAGCGHGQG